MINYIRKLLFGNGEKKEAKNLHDTLMAEKDKDIKDLQKVNKSIKLLLEEGHVEIVIKNVKGVIQEDYCREKKK